MQNLPRTFLHLLFLGSVLYFSSCGKDDDLCPDPTQPGCPDFDPCSLILPADARFMIYDSLYAFMADSAVAMPQDTGLLPIVRKHFRPLNVRFDTRYEWQVGLDARTFTDPIMNLDFSWEPPSEITIRLVATVERDDRSCLTASERADTSWQTLSLIEWPEDKSPPIYGEYLGSSTEYADSTYSIKIEWDETGTTLSAPYLYDMQRDCPDKPARVRIANAYDWFVTAHQRSRDRCQNFLAIGKLNDNDHREIKIDYWYDDDQGQRRHYVFTGRRQ